MKVQHIPSPYDEAMGLTQNRWKVTAKVLGSAQLAPPQPQKSAAPQHKKKKRKKKPQQAQKKQNRPLTAAEYDDLRQIDWFWVDPYIDD